MTNVFVVILNWNRKKDTLECLDSLSKLVLGKDIKLEIVVVDNASTDDSRVYVNKFLKHLTFNKKIKGTLLKNKTNLGFAAGNNVGITYALEKKADFVMLLNNDTVVDKKLLVGLLSVFDEYPKAGAISPKMYFAPGFEFHSERYRKDEVGKVIWYAGGRLDWNNVYGENRGVDEVDHGQYDSVTMTDFASGACMLLKSEVLKTTAGFDEKYYLYFEDTDLSIRITKLGWDILYGPLGHLWHKVSQSSGIGSNLNDYFITRNRLLFGFRYARIRARFALYRESLRLLLYGRDWQKRGTLDFYLGRFGKGSWQ